MEVLVIYKILVLGKVIFILAFILLFFSFVIVSKWVNYFGVKNEFEWGFMVVYFNVKIGDFVVIVIYEKFFGIFEVL